MSSIQFFISIVVMALGGAITWFSGLFMMEASSGLMKNDWYFTFLLSLPQWTVFAIFGIGLLIFVYGLGLFTNRIKI